MYLTYAEYQSMGGDLTETAFTRFEYMARKEIDRYTFNRLQGENSVRECVKMLMFELVGVCDKNDCTKDSVSSIGNDGYSESYIVMTKAEFDNTVYRLVKTYLSSEKTTDGTPILYCGVV